MNSWKSPKFFADLVSMSGTDLKPLSIRVENAPMKKLAINNLRAYSLSISISSHTRSWCTFKRAHGERLSSSACDQVFLVLKLASFLASACYS